MVGHSGGQSGYYGGWHPGWREDSPSHHAASRGVAAVAGLPRVGARPWAVSRRRCWRIGPDARVVVPVRWMMPGVLILGRGDGFFIGRRFVLFGHGEAAGPPVRHP